MSSGKAINVQDFINESPFSTFQWILFAGCFCVALLDGFDTAAIGFIAPSLVAEWGIRKADLAPVLSAALFGLACGAITSGPIADRKGRRLLLVGSVALFGVASVCSAFSPDLSSLTCLRFLTGLGLGAAMPTAVTLMTEYCPAHRRSVIVNMMFCGFPFGAGLGGAIAAWMIPTFGWRSVLLAGGVIPVLLAVFLLLTVPESVNYLVSKRRPASQILAALTRIASAPLDTTSFVLDEHMEHDKRGGARIVLSRQYRFGSCMLWLTYFMGLVIYYSVVNWMPVLLKDAGVDPAQATLVAALFPLGGIGAILAGALMDRFNPIRVVATCYAMTSIAVAAIGHMSAHISALMITVLIAGTLMNTAQSCLPALAAASYPTEGRGTGVAWMLGIGRFGGIAGSFLVAELSRRQMGMTGIFTIVACAGLLACFALLAKQAATKQNAFPEISVRETLGH